VLPSKHRLVAVWFQMIAAFSCAPLLAKDGQTTACVACSGLFLVLGALLPATRPTVRHPPFHSDTVVCCLLSVLVETSVTAYCGQGRHMCFSCRWHCR
jgi:hypothetical protein